MNEENYVDRRIFAKNAVFGAAGILCGTSFWWAAGRKGDPLLKHAFRLPNRNGWSFVHLEGTPIEIGYQYGYLLAPEIDRAIQVMRAEETHDGKHDWRFFRDTAKAMMWPRVDQEYRD